MAVGWRGTQIAGTVVLVSASLPGGAYAPAHEPVAPHRREPSRIATQYLRIAKPANRRLEIDFDRLAGPDHGRLTGAVADLRDATSTERMFDRDLLGLSLPPQAKVIVQDLARANEPRAKLTSTLATCRSLEQLRGDQKSLTAANAAVEEPVRAVRHQLGLAAPEAS